MRLDNLNIYMDGLAVHLCYNFRSVFCVWSDLSVEEKKYWKEEAYDLIKCFKEQRRKK